MKIKINIEKKHLYYLTGLISLIIIELVIGYGWSSEMPYHEILYTDRITGKSGTTITLDDSLVDVTGDLIITKGLTVKGELVVEGSFDKGITSLSSYSTGRAHEEKLTESMGKHKFCFLKKVSYDAFEKSSGTDQYYCEISGSFNKEWFLIANSDPTPGDSCSVLCDAYCVD